MKNNLKNAQEMKTRVPVSRMMAIHELLMTSRYPNRRSLAERLEVSAKTIQRDIDFMRDRLGLPIEYDEMKYGFFYTQPVHHFPTIEASEGEILALYIAQRALTTYQGTSLEGTLRRAFRKITDSLNERVSFAPEAIDSSISFRQTGLSMGDLQEFERVSEATIRSKEIVFEYRKLQAREFERRQARPYHFACVQNEWYLYAYDLQREEMRTFSLARMRSVEIQEKTFVRPADFNLDEYLADSFGVRTNSGKYAIKVRFFPPASRIIQERIWHRTQKIRELKDGAVELSMTLGSLTEVKKWILGWGRQAQVLAPKELIRRVSGDVKEMEQFYR